MRIVEKAAELHKAIRVELSRSDQKPKGWRYDHDENMRQAKESAKRLMSDGTRRIGTVLVEKREMGIGSIEYEPNEFKIGGLKIEETS